MTDNKDKAYFELESPDPTNIIDHETHDDLSEQSNGAIAGKFFRIVTATVSNNVLGLIFYIMNLYFIGLLNNAAMTAGFGLATMFVNITGNSLLVGCNCAQETLTSQAFGAGELYRCGVLLNRGRMILLTMYVPISCLLFYSESLFLLMR